MKNLKIILITTTIAILAIAAIGVAFAHNYGRSYDSTTRYSTDYEREDWWNEMRDRMEDHWDEVQDEEWYDDMRAYMGDHLDNVEEQDWFDDMVEFMQDHDEYGYCYDDNYSYSYRYRGCH